MMQALLEQYGTPLSYDGQKLYCFWEPQVIDAVTEQELRALKVGYRAKSIKRVTAAFVSQDIDEFELRSNSANTGCWPSTTFGKTCSGSARTSLSNGWRN